MTNARSTPLPANANLDWNAARGTKWNDGLDRMEAMLAPVDEPLLRALGLEAPCRIADIGCGGGATALEALRRAPAGSTVHGFDLSPALVETARRRIAAAPGSIAFDAADMATATPPAGPYDRLVSRFGVMFFPDDAAAFANLAGWLAPGGRFAFAVWGPASDNPWMSLVRDAVARVVPVPAAADDAPGPFRYADAGKLRRLLEKAGFTGVQSREWRGLLPVGGRLAAPQAAQFALSSFASFAELLARAGDETKQEAQQRLTEEFALHERDGSVQLGASVHIVTGFRASDDRETSGNAGEQR